MLILKILIILIKVQKQAENEGLVRKILQLFVLVIVSEWVRETMISVKCE